MNSRLTAAALTACYIFTPVPAFTATEDIPFSTTVTHSCTIVVTQDGILDPRNNFRRLTSRSGPGRPGLANVTATGNGFTLAADAPAAFNSEPAADVTPETFRAWHRSRGATSYNNTQSPRALNHGLSRIRIHMDARKSGGNVFEAGNYSATVVLRCE